MVVDDHRFFRERKIGMKLPTIDELENEGMIVESFPIDESLDNSNAGDASVYEYDGRLFQVIVWNDRALDHKNGEVEISELEVDDDE